MCDSRRNGRPVVVGTNLGGYLTIHLVAVPKPSRCADAPRPERAVGLDRCRMVVASRYAEHRNSHGVGGRVDGSVVDDKREHHRAGRPGTKRGLFGRVVIERDRRARDLSPRVGEGIEIGVGAGRGVEEHGFAYCRDPIGPGVGEGCRVAACGRGRDGHGVGIAVVGAIIDDELHDVISVCTCDELGMRGRGVDPCWSRAPGKRHEAPRVTENVAVGVGALASIERDC